MHDFTRCFRGNAIPAAFRGDPCLPRATREWAILAGENNYTTGTFQQITGRPPRPVTEFLHEYRAEFEAVP